MDSFFADSITVLTSCVSTSVTFFSQSLPPPSPPLLPLITKETPISSLGREMKSIVFVFLVTSDSTSMAFERALSLGFQKISYHEELRDELFKLKLDLRK